jgi:hypothetical protein
VVGTAVVGTAVVVTDGDSGAVAAEAWLEAFGAGART